MILRRWRDSDRDQLAALNSDPEVMEFMPKLLTRAESDAFVDRVAAHFDLNGFGLWAVEVEDGPEFVGWIGLNKATFESHFTPAVEVGWRLAKAQWGKGYASEGSRAALAYGFGPGALDEIVSFTAERNLRSERVMQRLGMAHDPADDFDHPSLPEGHRLRRHVLYRIRSDAV